ncbi:MAG: amidohydrolase family protein, partial [Gammaproteobacteria bacterium]|nr:amidohydrolase family protein [Gammaproteobacteria bacterium]
DRVLAVRCGNLIDGISDEALGGKLVLIRNDRIESVDTVGDIPEGAEVLDLSDYTCLPGLIDTHTHIALNHDDSSDLTIYYRRSMAETMAITLDNANTTLQAGFTTIRNVGDYFPEAIIEAREMIQQEQASGPRIQTAGSYLTIPGGGGDLVVPGHDESEIPAGVRIGVARGPEEFAAAAQRVLDNGADMIKVIASGAVFAFGGVPGSPEMTREEIAAVVEVARANGVKVTAHAHGAQSIKDAILAGVDSIEHASLADDEAIALAAERGVAFSMDVYNGTFTAEVGKELGYPDEFMRKNDETTEAQRIVFEKAYAVGVPIIYGTDAGVSPHGYNGKQFEVMVRRGMAPMDAIKSATSIAAEHMGLAADVGAIAVGRLGDLIAVKGNPLANVAMLQDVPVVIKGGSVAKKVAPQVPQFADVVYHTGRIYTVNPDQPRAQAVAIRNGKIEFVGSDDAVRAHIGPDTAVYDLHGRPMLPGFQDAHVHPLYAGLEALSCYLGETASIEHYRAIVSACAENIDDREWITGGGWSMAAFGPGAKAGKDILDELAPDRPVYLTSQDGHTGWANSRALEIAGITNSTPNPIDGLIDRDPETGEAIGSLQEGAMRLVAAHIPPPTAEERLAALEYARDLMHSVGITSFQKAYASEADLQTYEQLDKMGKLNMRVVVALLWDAAGPGDQIETMKRLREHYTQGNLRATSIKIFVDGVIENYTAVMLEPYRIESGTRGTPMIDPGEMIDVVSDLAAEGFQVHFHALGDGAARHALDAIEEANTRHGNADLRHHLSHLQVIHPDDHARFAELGAVANFQPLWAYADEYVVDLTLPFISEETARWMYPIKSILDAGGRVAFGSDWSVSSVNPMPQIETAVTRVDADSHATDVLNPEQRITIEQAIEAFTLGSAYVNHQEDVTGSIETGKFADLVVLDQKLFEIEPAKISDTKVLLTLFGGKAVYGNPADL